MTNYLFVDNYLSGMDPFTKAFIKNLYGFKLSADLNYVESAYGGANVTHKFDYGANESDPYKSHQIFPDEKEDLFNWFLYGILP